MHKQLAQELIACLGEGKMRFDYYPDRYGIYLLHHAAAEHRSVAALRRTPFASLLQKPSIKPLLARLGQGDVPSSWFAQQDRSEQEQPYRLTLDTWNGGRRHFPWSQTSRCGTNLVLQLNFPRDHVRAYRKLVQPVLDRCRHGPFDRCGHPVSTVRPTLAWARIDIDWNRSEALIEEIQTDWVRYARRAYEWARHVVRWRYCRTKTWHYRIRGSVGDVTYYYEQELAFHRHYWDEAMLTATLWFLRDAIGIRRLWYHTPASGNLFKRCGKPPRSVYTDLPRRFCFRQVGEIPAMIQAETRQKQALREAKTDKVTFHYLEL